MYNAANRTWQFHCSACARPFEFPWKDIGGPAQCPHCQKWWQTSWGFTDADCDFEPAIVGPAEPLACPPT